MRSGDSDDGVTWVGKSEARVPAQRVSPAVPSRIERVSSASGHASITSI